MQSIEPNHLFVYGTLMKDFENEMSQFLASHSQFIASGFFYGKLYEVDGFPGAILGNDKTNKVYGSILRLFDTAKIFKVLDAYEGIDATSSEPDLYTRCIVNANLVSGEIIPSWVYIYNLPVSKLTPIPSGKYV